MNYKHGMSAISQYLTNEQLQKKREYDRLRMRKYRAKKKAEQQVKQATTK
jgi:hypothetical protein